LNVPFASDVKYFYNNAGDANAYVIRDRDHNITNQPANTITAIVEYVGTGNSPLITALRIDANAPAVVDPTTVIFLRDALGGLLDIDEQVFTLMRGFDVDGVAISPNIPLAGSGGTVPAPSGGFPGFFNFAADALGRYTVVRIADGLGTTFGFYANHFATANSLVDGVLTLGIGTPTNLTDPFSVPLPTTFTSITNTTTIHDFRGATTGLPTGTPAVATVVDLNELLTTSATGVRISVVFNVAGHTARAIYIHNSTENVNWP
jgi:hypothetical protein